MNQKSFRRASTLGVSLSSWLLLVALSGCGQPAQAAPAAVEALVYSTMPSTAAHRPEMVMDGDNKTYFKSAYGMGDGDDFQILFAEPIPVRSLRIATGNADNEDLLTDGFVETSPDGITYTKTATFNNTGVAEANLADKPVAALRIRLNDNKGIPSLLLREITIDSPSKISRVLMGPGRGFVDISREPDIAEWAKKAEQQMEEFWPDTAALLYSDKFITPNKVNVVYRTGPNVTPVAATGGGVMTVNAKWCREHPEDTGLMVHEMAHVVQAMSAYNPVWLVEGVADYVRWVKFEPENHRPQINLTTSTYHDSYRTTGTFLAWCELNYDSRLVTKLNEAVRFGTYKNEMFKTYCGKDVDTLWAEFIAAYKVQKFDIIKPRVPPADKPRQLPVVNVGASIPVDLSKAFNAVGVTANGATFGINSGFDAGGAAFSSDLLGATQTWKNVQFKIGAPGVNNMISSSGNVIPVTEGKYASLWLLGAAVEGNQVAQTLTVTYTDGTTESLAQNFSDWFQPQSFPGESRAVKMAYRNMGDGARDPRVFHAYSYGFGLDPAKTVKSITLPNNPNVKILAITVAR